MVPGKTTIIKHIAGIYDPDKGEITINNKTVEETKDEMVYVSDDLYFFNTYHILEMAKFYAGIYKSFSWETFHKLQEIFKMDLKKRITKLSKGMKKQVAIWLALSCMPRILLLDEPIDGLDPIIKKKIFELLIKDVRKRKTTIIISSHNLKELEDVCTNIGVIKNGKMILEKKLDKLSNHIHKVQIVLGKQELPEKELKILTKEKQGSVMNIIVEGEKEEIEKTLKKCEPKVLDFLPLNLEEVFMYEMGGDNNEE